MKRVFSLICIAIAAFLVCSCASAPSNPFPNSNLSDPSLYRPQDRYEFFFETEEAYYYLYNERAYLSPKDSLKFYLLCSKPNCTHADENCDAYAFQPLAYWNGHIYSAMILADEPEIVRMNLDGSEHSVLTEIVMPLKASGGTGGSYFFYHNERYLYYYIISTPNSFFRVDLETGKTERLFESLFEVGTAMSERVVFNQGFLYLLFVEASGNRVLYRSDPQTAKLEMMCDWPEDTPAVWTVEGDILYYYSSERHVFCEYDFSTQEKTELARQPYAGGAATYGEDFIYLVSWNSEDDSAYTLSVFDREYHLLEKIDIPINGDFLYAAEDVLFFSNLPSRKITHYLPKSAIGTGEAELLPIEDPYSYR